MTPALRRMLAGNAALGLSIWLWFELPVRSVALVAANVLLAAAIVAGAWWLHRRCLSSLVPPLFAWLWIADGTLVRTTIAWVAAGVLFLALTRPKPLARGAALFCAGAIVPWLLVWWAPAIGGVGVQSASMAVRFPLAFALANWAYVVFRAGGKVQDPA